MSIYRKKIKALTAIICIAILAPFSSAIADDTDGRSKAADPLSFTLPAVQSFVIANGTPVYYVRDEIPQLTILVSIGYGTLYESKNQAGIADLIAKTISLAGSAKYPGEKLHQAIESIGGRFSISSSWERLVISIKVLERHAPIAVDILADILKNPNFDPLTCENARALLREGLRKKKDLPFELAFDMLRKIIFNGKGYGAVMNEESLNALAIEDLKQTWAKYVVAKNMVMGVSTSIALDAIKQTLGDALGTIDPGALHDYPADPAGVKDELSEKSEFVYFIEKDIPQATILCATIAPAVTDKDFFKLRVMNYILGEGSFNARLMTEIRVKRGLAYGVGSSLTNRKRTGYFMAYAQTNTQKSPLTLSLLIDNINKMMEEPVSAAELNLAKESIKNSYIFKFDNSLNILDKFIYLHYNKLDNSFYTRYIPKIYRVTDDEILESGKRLFEKGIVKIVVGKKELIGKLTTFGKVKIMR